jgi:ankyrin repeat protein
VYVAAQQGQVECIRLLHELGADVNRCKTSGASPVFIAAQQGHVECIRVLPELGVDVNKCRTGGASPVCIAAEKGHVECLRLLSELGANVQPLLQLPDATVLGPSIVQIVQNVRSFLDAIG